MTNMTVSFSGPLFKIGGKALRNAVKDTAQELVEEGEQRLDQMLRPRPAGVFLSINEAAPGKASSGNYRRNVHGEVRGTTGTIDDSGVVYGPWLEGVSSRNQSTRFKGYASFRRTRDRLQEDAIGIATKHVKKAARKLS